jgi:hypothetical protein
MFRMVAAVTHPLYILKPHLIDRASQIFTLALKPYRTISKQVMRMPKITKIDRKYVKGESLLKMTSQSPLRIIFAGKRNPILLKISSSFLLLITPVGRL